MNNKLYKKYGFDSNKGLRKLTYDVIKEDYRKNIGSCIESTYKGFIIFVTWVKNDGITGFIFYNNRLISCIHYFYKDPEEIIKQSKRYIDYIKPLLSSCE